MKVRVDTNGEVRSRHLPPVDDSLLLKIGRNGQVKPIEMLDTPVDEHGIPTPLLYLEQLGSTLAHTYEPPKDINVHHLVYPKADYRQFGEDSVQYKYRETPAVKLKVPVQIHNYGHRIMLPPKMPSLDVMSQYVKEQEQVARLFRIGRATIAAPRWLEEMYGNGAQQYHAAERYVENQNLTEDSFFDALDAMSEGSLGLMPDKQRLADMGLPAATRYLGVLADARSLALHREARQTTARYDVS